MTKPKRSRPALINTTWRPERKDKAHLYAVMYAFLAQNPGMKYAQLVDFAICRLFAEHDPGCRALYEADVVRFHPVFEQVQTPMQLMDLPPDNLPVR